MSRFAFCIYLCFFTVRRCKQRNAVLPLSRCIYHGINGTAGSLPADTSIITPPSPTFHPHQTDCPGQRPCATSTVKRNTSLSLTHTYTRHKTVTIKCIEKRSSLSPLNRERSRMQRACTHTHTRVLAYLSTMQ